MTTPIKFAAAAAAIGVLAVVVGIVPRTAGPGVSNLVSPSPSPTAAPIALPIGDLEAGTTYSIGDPGSMGYIFTVPAPGWSTIDTWFLGKDDLSPSPYLDVVLLPGFVGNLHADPCHWKGSVLDPAVGPTVDDLATAFMEQAPQNASAVSDVTFGDYVGKKVEMSSPDDVETACDEGNYGRWYGDDPSTYGPFTYGNGQRDTVYIVDVEGTRVVIDAIHLPDTSEADLAELEQLVASLRFERLPPSPSPAPSPSAAG